MQLIVKQQQRVLLIKFNRPEKKNALTSEMYLAMIEALNSAQQNQEIRAVWLQGAPQIFTAGNDLEDFLKNPPATEDAPVLNFLRLLAQFEKPIVASVHGPAVGIGTTLLLHCDLVYAADNASFCMPFASLGLCPEAASSMLLPRLTGYQRAAEKLLLGSWFNAQEAQDFGLVNAVLPPNELDPQVEVQLARLVVLPPAAIRATKALMKKTQQTHVLQHMNLEAEQFRAMLAAPEAREAFTAFFEKRKPDFSQF